MHFLLLCALIVTALAGIGTVDFAATTPLCYDHQTGGGSFNNKGTPWVVESLEGGDFACGDVVSFLWYVELNDDPRIPASGVYSEFHLIFTGTTTGQEGVGFTQVRTGQVYINSPGVGYVHGDGCTYQTRTAGTCVPTTSNCNRQTATSFDSGVLSFGPAEDVTMVRQWFSTAPPFSQASQLNVVLRIGGCNRKDRIVIRIDVEIGCDPFAKGPTGNIQGALYQGWWGTQLAQPNVKPAYLTNRATADIGDVWSREGNNHIADVIFIEDFGAGQQTVPLKSVGDIKPCTPPTPVTCIDFTSDLTVTNENAPGFSTGKFYYCWTSGKMKWSFGGSTGTASTAIRTFDAACTSNRLSLYDTQVSTCGSCELAQQFPTSLMPQLCYNPQTYYYMPDPASETVNGIAVWHYVANSSTIASTGVTDLWLSKTATNGIFYPVRIRWNDGQIFTFSNVVPGCPADTTFTPTTCTSFGCSRPMDLILAQELSVHSTYDDQVQVRNFITALIQRFTFGPNAVQMAYMTYNITANVRLPLSSGTSAANVGAAVNATGCTSCPQCATCTGAAYPSVAIRAAADLAAASTRPTATSVMLLIANEIDEPAANLQSAIAYAASKGLYVVTVAYNSGTPADLFYNAVSDPGKYGLKTDNFWYVPFPYQLPLSANVIQIATRLCGLVAVADACATCCTALLCNTAQKLCTGGTPCDNSLLTCPPIFADGSNSVLHCSKKATKDAAGCCTTVNQNLCDATLNASCYSKTCNETTGWCEASGGCLQPIADCREAKCQMVNGEYSCVTAAKPLPPQPPGCVEVVCVNNDWVWQTLNCTGSDACQSKQCVNNVCQFVPIADPQANLANPCNQRTCDPVDGWKSTPVVCTPPGDCWTSSCNITTGSCDNVKKVCNDPTNLCDITTCSGNVCQTPKQYKQCTPSNLCYQTSTCQPSTGLCLDSNPVVCTFDNAAGCPTKCVNGSCVPFDCPPPPVVPPPVATPAPVAPPPPTGPVCALTCKNKPCELYECKEVSAGVTFCDGPKPRDCSAQLDPLNNCQVVRGCNATTGCVIEERVCANENIPTKPCEVVVQDPTDARCCKVVPKTCVNDNPCVENSCDATTGQCTAKNLCVSPDPCLVSKCQGSKCVITPFCSSGVIDPNTCSTKQCINNASGTFCGGITAGCTSPDPCTSTKCVNGTCTFAPLCSNNTADLCTITQCQVTNGIGACVSKPVPVGVSTGCVRSGCDPKTGPFTTLNNSICDLNNPCVTSICKDDGTCESTPVSCEGVLANQSFCKPAVCIDFIGCVLQDLDCYNYTDTQPSNNSCEILQCVDCDPKDQNCSATKRAFYGHCKKSGGECFPLYALIGGLTGGIVAAIVVAALIAAALCGGGVGAAATASNNFSQTAVFNNPTYVDSGTSGWNPLQEHV